MFNEEQKAEIRRMIQEEMDHGYRSGDPQIAPHSHNGNDNLRINIADVDGVIPVRQMEGGVNFLNQLTPTGSDTGVIRPAQYLANPEIAVIGRIPVIQGNGPGVQGAFNGGDAPVGTMVAFSNGNVLSTLWVKVIEGPTGVGEWIGFNVDSVI